MYTYRRANSQMVNVQEQMIITIGSEKVVPFLKGFTISSRFAFTNNSLYTTEYHNIIGKTASD